MGVMAAPGASSQQVPCIGGCGEVCCLAPGGSSCTRPARPELSGNLSSLS